MSCFWNWENRIEYEKSNSHNRLTFSFSYETLDKKEALQALKYADREKAIYLKVNLNHGPKKLRRYPKSCIFKR